MEVRHDISAGQRTSLCRISSDTQCRRQKKGEYPKLWGPVAHLVERRTDNREIIV